MKFIWNLINRWNIPTQKWIHKNIISKNAKPWVKQTFTRVFIDHEISSRFAYLITSQKSLSQKLLAVPAYLLCVIIKFELCHFLRLPSLNEAKLTCELDLIFYVHAIIASTLYTYHPTYAYEIISTKFSLSLPLTVNIIQL